MKHPPHLTSWTLLCPPLVQWSIALLDSFTETHEDSGAPSWPCRRVWAFLILTGWSSARLRTGSSPKGLLNSLYLS